MTAELINGGSSLPHPENGENAGVPTNAVIVPFPREDMEDRRSGVADRRESDENRMQTGRRESDHANYSTEAQQDPTTLVGRITEPDSKLMPYTLLTPLAGDTKPARNESLSANYECYATYDPAEITEARQLVAGRYLHLGFIKPEEIGEDGTLKPEADPYAEHATYYVLRDRVTGDLVATSRRIHYDPEAGEASFPVWEHKDELDPEYVRQVEEIGLEHAVEISALVRNPAYKSNSEVTMSLYRRMFQDAFDAGEDGEKIFLMACKPSLYKNFRKIFDGATKQIGPPLDYPGEIAVPAMIPLREGMVQLIEKSQQSILTNRHNFIHKRVVSFLLKGANAETLDPTIIQALQDNNMTSVLGSLRSENGQFGQGELNNRRSLKERLKRRKPEILAALGLLAYTGARTVGVADIQTHMVETGLDWRVFLGIEVGTTAPYVWGMGDMARSIAKPENFTTRQRAVAASMAGGSLLAPYAYVIAEGGNMPTTAWEGIGAVAAISGLSVFAKLRKSRQQRRAQATEAPQPLVPELAVETEF